VHHAGLGEGRRLLRDQVFHHQPAARIEGAAHIEFHEHTPRECTNKIVEMAIERFKNRPARITIPQRRDMGVHGFSHEYVNYMLAVGSGLPTPRSTKTSSMAEFAVWPAWWVVTNPRVKQDYVHVELVKELIKNNVLVFRPVVRRSLWPKPG